MNGKTDEEILKERKIAIGKAKEIAGEDVEVIDTFYTLQKGGKKNEDVKLSTSVQRNMVLKPLQVEQMNVFGDFIGIVVDREK